jgi:hypothetical protein
VFGVTGFGPAAGLTFSQRAAAVLEAVTGAPIGAGLFTDPWTGGLTAPDLRPLS